MKKILFIVALSGGLCQLSAECMRLNENEKKSAACDNPIVRDCAIDECSLEFDPFDALADEDVLAGVSFDMQSSMVPAWCKSAAIAVVLKLAALHEVITDRYEALKKLLGMGGQ